MPPAASITIIDATPAHFDAIVEIERTSTSGSVVGLAGADALQQMIARGHWIAVAAAGDEVAGWIWFSIEIDRGGETTGQVFRVAVADKSRRSGVASALMEHARCGVRGSRGGAHSRVNGFW